MHRIIIFLSILFIAGTSNAESVRVSVSEVKDTRSTGEFFNDLEIKFNVTGDDVADVKGFRVNIEKAVDNTGRNLLKNEVKNNEFEVVQESSSGHPNMSLKFRNPARRATVIKQLSGKLQLFIPGRDPNSTIIVKNFTKTIGTRIINPAFSKADLQLIVMTKKEYDKVKKQEEQKAKEVIDEKKIDKALIKAFEGLFSAFFQVGEYDLIFKVSDPGEKLIDIAVLDGQGARIDSHGHMQSKDLRIINYSEALPDDAQLQAYLRTDKAVISIPFMLTDIGLP